MTDPTYRPPYHTTQGVYTYRVFETTLQKQQWYRQPERGHPEWRPAEYEQRDDWVHVSARLVMETESPPAGDPHMYPASPEIYFGVSLGYAPSVGQDIEVKITW